MPSIRYISEQVMLRLKGGRVDQANRRDIREVDAAVRQAVNERYGGSYLNVTLPLGETIPEGMLLATFEDVPVYEWKDRSRVDLPIMPVALPRGIGVFEVTAPDNPDCVFIPALPGQGHMVADQEMLSSVLPTALVMVYGRHLEFSEVLDVKFVLLRLVVNDASAQRADGTYILGLYDPISMPSDWEAPIIDTVYKRFAPMVPSDNKTDMISENTTGR